MCEQAAKAHKSNGAIQSSRRNRIGSDAVQLCKSSADSILDRSSSAAACQTRETPSRIFLINCLAAIQQLLLGHELASEYVEKLGVVIESHTHSLVEKEVNAILRRCGLSNKMSYFRASSNIGESDNNSDGKPLAEILPLFPTVCRLSLALF